MLVAARGAGPAEAQYAEAANMTEKFGALVALSSAPGAAREQALDDFARAYADEPLILDKWLALQAQIGEPETLDRVRRLMRHPAFSLANPNRTRALIGGFAANPTQFNRADGAGYDFLADIVLQLDGANPQIAARLLTAMRSWRTLEPRRREQAYAALMRIGARETLSADVRDIVTRSTQGGLPT
jgi:aminopeptidase N